MQDVERSHEITRNKRKKNKRKVVASEARVYSVLNSYSGKSICFEASLRVRRIDRVVAC
jgi:hypothetical protein